MPDQGWGVRSALVSLASLLAITTAAIATGPAISQPERAVRGLERSWLDAYEQLDTLAMDRIVADDFQITFPNGSTWTKRDVIEDLRLLLNRHGPPYETKFRTEGVSSRAYGKTVVLTGVLITTVRRGAGTAEDRARYTDTYVERDGRWQVVASHLSNANGNPTAAPAGKRFVQNSTLVSRESPRMNLTVDPRLPFIGELSFDLKQAARVQRFVFGSRDEQGRPARMVIVQFESVLPGAKGGYAFGLENPTRLGSYDYQTQTGFFNFDESAAARPGAEAERTRAFLADRGWSVAGEDFLVARFARIIGAEKRSELILFYLENVRTMDRTRKELGADGRATELAGLQRDVAARAKVGFTIRDLPE